VKKRRRMFFDLLILGKSSSVLLFSLAVGLVPLFVFAWLSVLATAVFVLLHSSRRRRRASCLGCCF